MSRRGSTSEPPLFPLGSFCVLSFCIFPFSSSLGDNVFPFPILWLSWVWISGRDVTFWKLSISEYLLPFSSVSEYYILASLFPSYNYALLACVHLQTDGFHGTPARVFLSIPSLVACICCTPFFANDSPFKEVSHFFSIVASSLKVNMQLYIFLFSCIYSVSFPSVSLFLTLNRITEVSSPRLFQHMCSLF